MANDEVRRERIKKLELLTATGASGYPAQSNRTISIADYLVAFDSYVENAKPETLAGRVLSIRGQGGIAFMDVFDGTARMQFVLEKNEIVIRESVPAKSLSEGERTAIGFVYFVTQLKDENFDPEKGIVVVDDPISSLDANSQFQAFSFLKTATNQAGQLFLFTHNFDFLKLILGFGSGLNSGLSGC